MTIRPVCGAVYSRGDDQVALRCTYIAGHHDRETGVATPHSWDGIRCLDLADQTRVDYTPQAVQAFLDSMTRGEMDAYIEAILAVAHNRKRAQRGVAGFTHQTLPGQPGVNG